MSFARSWLRGSVTMAAAASLAACAQHGALLPSAPLTTAPLNQSMALPDLVPPNCKGQIKTKNYATLTVTLSTKGGSMCVPAFGGFGGGIKYPPANPSVKLKLTSSTTNYNGKLPKLGKGTPIFYLQLGLMGGTTFGTNVPTGGGLTSAKIVAGKTYTAYGQAVIYGYKLKFGPCYKVAVKGQYGGVIGGVGTLLKGVNVPVAANGVIEIYAGKQATTKC